MDHFYKWCVTNQVDLRASPVKSVANFLCTYCMTGSYSPAPLMVTGHPLLINWEIHPSNISKDENLTRLLDSFHRDRPKGRFILDKTDILDTSPICQRCPCIHHPAFYPRISWPKRVQTVWPLGF